uniref:Sugar phosphate exchanger 3 n=1 Tax=Syphacia muris TaxID=451379 RepID=A0A0N5AUP0_9BILA
MPSRSRSRTPSSGSSRRVTCCSHCLSFLSSGEQWTYHHLYVFLLTFFSYALLHASRKTLSTVKGSLIETWTHNNTLFVDIPSAESFLALLDGGFLGAYAVGLYVSGFLGDRYSPSKVLGIGMFFSAVMVFLFGTVTEWMHFYSKIFYMVTWIGGGFIQSLGWPTEVCIMGNWFGHKTHGAVLGLWSSCASVGNVIGTMIASRAIIYGYEYAFGINAALLLLGSFIILLCLNSTPQQVGLTNPNESEQYGSIADDDIRRPEPISFCRAWLLPGVLSYSLAYACLKMVNYSFFFWLPFYLHNHYNWNESLADGLSIWYDLGGIVAAVIAGVLSDKYNSRTPIVVLMLTVAMGTIFAYAKSPKDILINSLLMTVTGFFIGGPANLVSAAISADLGKAEEIRGSAEALSTVSGIIDGTGSIGASVGQILLPVVQNAFGWDYVFYSFIVMILMSVICLIPLTIREIRCRRKFNYSILPADESIADTIDATQPEASTSYNAI